MMLSQWSVKPPVGTPINRSHPLAQGLVLACPLNEAGGPDVRDYASASTATTRDTGGSVDGSRVPVWKATPYGIGVQFDGTFQFGNFGNTASNRYPLSSIFSAAWLLMVPTPTSGNNGLFGCGINGIEIRIASGKINLLKATAVDMGSSATTMAANTFYSGGISYDGSTARYFLNGGADGTSSNAQTFAVNPCDIGGPGTSEVLQSGSVLVYVYVWSRVLNASEFQDVANNPWSLFAPRTSLRLLYAGGSASPGTSAQPMQFILM